MRKLAASSLLVLPLACSTTPTTEGGTSDTSGTTTTTETGEPAETGESETGEPKGMECPSEPPLDSAFMDLNPFVNESELPLTCEVAAEPEPDSIELSCEIGGETQAVELQVSVDPGLVESYPVQVGQMIVIDSASGDGGIRRALVVRDLDSERLLLTSYVGWQLPQDFDPPIDESIYAPLSVGIADTLCITECENFQGPGVPPECDCERKVDLEFRGGPDTSPTLIRDHSWSMLEVPGEGDAFVGVWLARICEDGIEPTQFGWLYVAASE